MANVSGANTCGQPKFMRSTDGANWTTRAPDTRSVSSTADVYAPTAVFVANDRLDVVFKIRGSAPSIAPGLSLWRER